MAKQTHSCSLKIIPPYPPIKSIPTNSLTSPSCILGVYIALRITNPKQKPDNNETLQSEAQITNYAIFFRKNTKFILPWRSSKSTSSMYQPSLSIRNMNNPTIIESASKSKIMVSAICNQADLVRKLILRGNNYAGFLDCRYLVGTQKC